MTSKKAAQTKKAEPVSIALSAAELNALVSPIQPLVDQSGHFPLLCAVVVESKAGTLYAYGTDRYRMGVQRIRPEAAVTDGFKAIIPLRSLARIKAVFKATRHSNPALTLTAEGDSMTVEAAGALVDLMSARIVVPLEIGEYPDVLKIVAHAAAATPEPVAAGAFSPRQMGDFAAAQRGGEGMVLSAAAPKASGGHDWLVRVGEDFIGLIARSSTPSLPDLATSWADALPILDKKEVAA